MYLDGSVYRGRKPIHWCKRCHTALAEAEIEYSDETSPSIFVKFKMDLMPGMFEAAGAVGDAYVLIWTTTLGRCRRTPPCRWRPTPTT